MGYDVDDVLARQLMVARFDGAFLCKRCASAAPAEGAVFLSLSPLSSDTEMNAKPQPGPMMSFTFGGGGGKITFIVPAGWSHEQIPEGMIKVINILRSCRGKGPIIAV